MKKVRLTSTRVYRACLGCPGPHEMEMPPSVAERLGELGCGVTCATCPSKESHQKWQREMDEKGGTFIYTQEKLDEVLDSDVSPAFGDIPTLLELMEA
jgi:hypothetical protein